MCTSLGSGDTSITLWAYSFLSKSYSVLWWFLQPVCWVVVRTIAWPSLTKVVLHSILINKPLSDYRVREFCQLDIYNWFKTMDHWLEIKPKLTGNELFRCCLLFPIREELYETIQISYSWIIFTHNCFPTCTKKFNYQTCVVYHLYCCIKCTAILSIICQMSLVGLQRGKTKNKQLNTLSQKMAGALILMMCTSALPQMWNM